MQIALLRSGVIILSQHMASSTSKGCEKEDVNIREHLPKQLIARSHNSPCTNVRLGVRQWAEAAEI